MIALIIIVLPNLPSISISLVVFFTLAKCQAFFFSVTSGKTLAAKVPSSNYQLPKPLRTGPRQSWQ